MKIKTTFRSFVFALLMCLTSLIVFSNAIIQGNQAGGSVLPAADSGSRAFANQTPSCPDGGTPQGNQCILKKPLVFNSQNPNKLLDCNNLHLVPTSSGSGTTPSNPEVAIFLEGAHSLEIKRCFIEDFDFGIFAVNSKVSDPTQLAQLQNRIHDNTIVARYAPITLFSVDDTVIGPNNDLTFKTVAGRGVVVEDSSNLNTINGNTITGKMVETNARRVPGNVGSTLPVATGGAAIVVGEFDSNATLLNAVINFGFYQFAPSPVPASTATFTNNNKVLGNHITILPNSADTTDGVVLPVAQATTIDGNTISGAAFAIRVGIQAGTLGQKKFPSRCTGDVNRLCLSNADCDFQILIQRINRGTCPVPSPTPVNWFSNGTTISSNKIDTFGGGITLAGSNTTVTGNEISGPQRLLPSPSPTPTPSPLPSPTAVPASPGAIFIIGPSALDTAIITHNTVTNVLIALSLQDAFAGLSMPMCAGSSADLCSKPCLHSQITLNDFTAYGLAVQTGEKYSLLTDLSVNRKGNFWGSNCFPTVEKAPSGAGPNAFVTDCNPFGGSVAKATVLPGLCG
jgi:parallel beta-helix repeat protein